jgi:hypothetical protein
MKKRKNLKISNSERIKDLNPKGIPPIADK